MPMWGKLIGGFFGALLAGPLGALFGIMIGHAFDRSLKASPFVFHAEQGSHSHAQSVFFDATFLVMGHVAKADGYVSEQEIQAAYAVMSRLGLTGAAKQNAIDLFRKGKQPEFQLQETLHTLLQACRRNPILLQMFVEIQWQVANSDGHLSAKKQQVLRVICQNLGITLYNFSAFEDFFRPGYQHTYQHTQTVSPKNTQTEAYKTLGISSSSTDVEVKKAYRRLMSQNHPDKLIAKGLPEEMVKLATEKTQNIRAAYDLICKSRGI